MSDHPLMGLEKALRNLTDVTIRDLLDSAMPGEDGTGDVAAHGREAGAGVSITTGGVVTALVRRYTRRGELMATFMLEDLEAAIEVMVFPKTDDRVRRPPRAGRHRRRAGPARSA